jgi:tetratricopeptide (TPR) repeat protein
MALDKASIIKEAQKYLAKGQIDKAIAEWEKVLQGSQDANAFNTVGDLYLKKNDRQNAIERFHRAAEIFRKEGFSLKALALYKKILNINPHDAKSHLALGELNEEKNIATDAIKYYLAAGDMFHKANQKTEAVNTYKRILKIASGNLSMRLKIAELFSKEGFAEETAEEYVSISAIYEEQGELEKAKDYLEKAIEIKPGNRAALIGLGNFYEKRGEAQKALDYFKTAIVKTGKSNELVLKAARLAFQMEDYTDAREFADAVVESDPSNLEARRLIAEILMRQGDMEAAWKEYAPVLDELIFLNRLDEAIEILLLFKEIEPVEARRKLITFYKQKEDNESALRELREIGEILEESGMLQEATGCYKEALSLAPDDEDIKARLAELEKVPSDEEDEKEQKPVEQVLVEAEVFLGYALYEDARRLLEGLKLRAPGNVDLHLKLKTLYKSTNDHEQAVTECIILSELYKRSGDAAAREAVIKEAFSINRGDPRLIDRFGQPPEEPEEKIEDASTGDERELEEEPSEEAAPEHARQEGDDGSQSPEVVEPAETGSLPSGDNLFESGGELDNYSEDLSEADFYVKQGILDEAEEIYRRLLASFPENQTLKAKLEEIDNLRIESEKMEEAIAAEEAELANLQSITIDDVMGSEEPAEPAIESDVLEIFEEFKKGLAKELEAEDTETHYNLGIAYKEMGLLDDAIREFQVSRQDPKFFIHSASMLGVCYMEKGLYPLAIEAIQSALMKVTKKEEAHWGLKYDLALAFEKSGKMKEALDLFMEVYGWDSKFRDVADKISVCQAGAGKRPVVAVSPKEAHEAPPAGREEKEGEGTNREPVKKNRVSYI